MPPAVIAFLLKLIGPAIIGSVIAGAQWWGAKKSAADIDKQIKSAEKLAKGEHEFQASLAQKQEAVGKGVRAEAKAQEQRDIKSKVKAEAKMPGRAAAMQLSDLIRQLMPMLMSGGMGGMEGAPQQGMQAAQAPQDAQALATTPITGEGGQQMAGAGQPSAAMALQGGGQGAGAGTFEELLASIPGSTFSNPLMVLRAQGWDLPSYDEEAATV